MNEELLNCLYEDFTDRPGWLSRMIETLKLSESDVEYLSWLDNQHNAIQDKVKRYKDALWREANPVVLGCESDVESLDVVNKLVFQLEQEYQRLFANDATHHEKQLFLWASRYDFWKKMRYKIRGRMLHSEVDARPGGITDADIERARSVPFETFTEPIKGYILCLWHEDVRPSMWIKNGFGYCFTCTAWCDPIKWWMKQNGRNFVESVKSLNSL